MTIKEKIMDKINSIEDVSTLEEIYQMVKIQAKIDEVYHPSPEERLHVEQGIADADNERLYAQEEAEKIYRKWKDEKLNGLQKP